LVVHDEVSGALGPSKNAPVAIRHLSGEHLASPGPVELAPPFPFGELRLFVFGYDPLDLDQQPGLRVVVDGRGIGELDHDPEAGELVQDQHLVSEGAGQAVRRQAPHSFDRTLLGRVA
jgi:hypothetical protein